MAENIDKNEEIEEMRKLEDKMFNLEEKLKDFATDIKDDSVYVKDAFNKSLDEVKKEVKQMSDAYANQVKQMSDVYANQTKRFMKKVDIMEKSIEPKTGKYSILLDKTTSQGIVIVLLIVGIIIITTSTLITYGVDQFLAVLSGLGILIAPVIYYLGNNGAFAKARQLINEVFMKTEIDKKNSKEDVKE